jgi:hypothetical protein
MNHQLSKNYTSIFYLQRNVVYGALNHSLTLKYFKHTTVLLLYQLQPVNPGDVIRRITGPSHVISFGDFDALQSEAATLVNAKII